ncbi:emp24p/erv25p- protein [Mycoemilia scoparia]|uniref:Emp24p/erv25p- protein n=1 Tax=Mycoemilia scoparia TaxID=417184 RepID=A0A9W8DR13_9FUNG|nr:emp24p/erv25p- protein [Mycoemilia scoparia]
MMHNLSAILLLFLSVLFQQQAAALHFYLRGNDKKCFIEELPSGVLVKGNYKAEEWNESQKNYFINPNINVQTTVDELPSQLSIINQKGASEGKLTFTAAHNGRHHICFQITGASGWVSSSIIKMTLHIDSGEIDEDGSLLDQKIEDMASLVKELNTRVLAIKSEQKYQREREEEFMSFSNKINRRVLYWAVLQLGLIGAICYWQLHHLRGFFEAKKLV